MYIIWYIVNPSIIIFFSLSRAHMHTQHSVHVIHTIDHLYLADEECCSQAALHSSLSGRFCPYHDFPLTSVVFVFTYAKPSCYVCNDGSYNDSSLIMLIFEHTCWTQFIVVHTELTDYSPCVVNKQVAMKECGAVWEVSTFLHKACVCLCLCAHVCVLGCVCEGVWLCEGAARFFFSPSCPHALGPQLLIMLLWWCIGQ